MQNPKPSPKSIEELCSMLERIHGRPFSYEEAEAIGTWWLGYVSKLVDYRLPADKTRKKNGTI